MYSRQHTVAVSTALCLRECHDKEPYYFFLLMNTNPSNGPDGPNLQWAYDDDDIGCILEYEYVLNI